jgi:hypothetical protein
MSSGQVSVWVPIVVAVLGILGVVTGQLINFRREDRRWERERQREDVRWERERQRDVDAQWRERRFDVHVELLAAFREWEAALARAVADRAAGNDPAEPDTLTAHANRVNEAVTTLTIFGPDKVAATADDVYLEFRRLHDYALGHRELDKPHKHQPYLPILLMGLRDEIRDTLRITVRGTPSDTDTARTDRS